MAHGTVMVTLVCHHVLHFKVSPPVRGQAVWCRRCVDYRTVVTALEQYNIRCLQCRYARHFGRMLDTARERAHRHVRIRQAHKVEVRDGLHVLETVTYDSVSLYRPEALQGLKQHQNILRATQQPLPNRYPDIR